MLSQFFHGKYDLKGFRYCYEYSDISQNKLDLSQKINSLGGTINISPQDATVILIDKESNLRKKISKEISEDYEIVLYRSQSKPIKIELIEHFNRKSNSFELPNEATSDQLLNNLQSKKLKRYMYIEGILKYLH